MKTHVIKFTALFLVVVLTATILQAQNKEKLEEIRNNKNAIGSLIEGINSDIEGLRKSCIYFVGQYQIPEAVEHLVKVLKKEENPQTRVLIALVLYKIGDPDGMAAVRNLIYTDDNNYVKGMSKAIFNAYIYDNVMAAVSGN